MTSVQLEEKMIKEIDQFLQSEDEETEQELEPMFGEEDEENEEQ